MGSGDGIVNAMPYLVKATDEGFHVDLPKKVFSTEILKTMKLIGIIFNS